MLIFSKFSEICEVVKENSPLFPSGGAVAYSISSAEFMLNWNCCTFSDMAGKSMNAAWPS